MYRATEVGMGWGVHRDGGGVTLRKPLITIVEITLGYVVRPWLKTQTVACDLILELRAQRCWVSHTPV